MMIQPGRTERAPALTQRSAIAAPSLRAEYPRRTRIGVRRQRAAAEHRRRVSWSPASGTQLPGTLAVRTLGIAGPPIMLLHGLPSSGRFWGADYDDLATDARLVVPDLLGFGGSPRPTGGYGPDDHADAVAATLRGIAAHTPALVVGHSVGALVALRLAVRHPSLVAGVIGFGPPLYRDYADARRHVAQLGPLARLFGLDTRWAELACTFLCQHHRGTAARLAARLRPDLPAALAADAVEHSWESFSETLARVVLTADAPRWLDEIDAPVHVIAGDDDPLVDVPFLHELARRHPRLDVDVWPGVGHNVPLTDPTLCRAEIARELAASPTRNAA